MRDSLKGLRREGFRYVHVLNSIEEIDAVEIVRTRLWTDKTDEHGPFDFIGDVHGCFDELRELLEQLGYAIGEGGKHGYRVIPPAGRTAIFLGDLIDRGPNSPDVLRLVMGMVASGTAYCLPGNHDDKLLRYLQGRNVQIAHGLAETIEQLRAQPAEFSGYVLDFLDSLVSHYVLDGGKLVVAHGGMPEEYQNRSSRRVRDIALFGVTTGEEDELGLPVRIDWGADYRGQALVVYGHTPVAEPEWVNRTINIDTGCVFGGRLTALRYPECELVSVSARRAYSETARPFLAEKQDAPESEPRKYDDLLEIDDVLGRRGIETRLMGRVTVRAEQAAAALEVVSRFALDPRRLIYLPPTMSPVAATTRDGLLEHPTEAFDYFHSEGVARVMCQEKHMGSRYRDRRA
jgi:protein phosphatase